MSPQQPAKRQLSAWLHTVAARERQILGNTIGDPEYIARYDETIAEDTDGDFIADVLAILLTNLLEAVEIRVALEQQLDILKDK
jgi:hypothetical protein